jgi:hypothetical protein
MALHRVSSPQQSMKCHHWTIAQSSPIGLRNQTIPIRKRCIKQSGRRRSPETNDGETSSSHRRTEQISSSVSATITILPRR